MATFYQLSKDERVKVVETIGHDILSDIRHNKLQQTIAYFADADTYIRKATYIAMGRIYLAHKDLQAQIIDRLNKLLHHNDFKVRQSVINAAGEIGKKYFYKVETIFDSGLLDAHHAPRNAVIGSVKKMGEVNPKPILLWAKKYLHHADKEIRREICHGIELRGRTHPQDILPLLKELQHDKTARVRNTLVHVIGQIAYKKGCLQTVVADLKTWDNKQLVAEALEEIIDVHHRYRNFAAMTQDQARQYIADNY